jgi:hypothetical protein
VQPALGHRSGEPHRRSGLRRGRRNRPRSPRT